MKNNAICALALLLLCGACSGGKSPPPERPDWLDEIQAYQPAGIEIVLEPADTFRWDAKEMTWKRILRSKEDGVRVKLSYQPGIRRLTLGQCCFQWQEDGTIVPISCSEKATTICGSLVLKQPPAPQAPLSTTIEMPSPASYSTPAATKSVVKDPPVKKKAARKPAAKPKTSKPQTRNGNWLDVTKKLETVATFYRGEEGIILLPNPAITFNSEQGRKMISFASTTNESFYIIFYPSEGWGTISFPSRIHQDGEIKFTIRGKEIVLPKGYEIGFR